jgi:MbtH protein
MHGFQASKEKRMTNPFENENGVYHVLINDEGQHSLWPSFVEVPSGWTIIRKSDTRAACLEFINRNWTDMRPQSLIEAMKTSPKDQREAANWVNRTKSPTVDEQKRDGEIVH